MPRYFICRPSKISMSCTWHSSESARVSTDHTHVAQKLSAHRPSHTRSTREVGLTPLNLLEDIGLAED